MNSDERKEFILSPHHTSLGANRLQLMEMTPKDTRKRHPKAKFRRAGVNSKNRSGLHYKAKKQLEHSVGTAEPTLGKKMGAPFRSNTHPIEQVGFLVVLLYFCHCSESYTYFSDIQYFQRLSLRFHFEEFLYWLNPTSSRFVLHLMENTVQLLITGQETAACSAMQYWSAGLQTGASHKRSPCLFVLTSAWSKHTDISTIALWAFSEGK